MIFFLFLFFCLQWITGILSVFEDLALVLVGIRLDRSTPPPPPTPLWWRMEVEGLTLLVNTHGEKKRNNQTPETCLTVWPWSPFDVVVLGPDPATLCVRSSDVAQTVIIVIPWRGAAFRAWIIFIFFLDNKRVFISLSLPRHHPWGVSHMLA